MAEAANNPEQVPEEELYQEDTLAERFMEWVRTELIWYAGSFTFHLLLLSSLLLLGNVAGKAIQGDAPGFDSADKEEKTETDPPPLEKFDIGETPEDPTELTTETLTMEKPAVQAQTEEYNDDSEKFEHQAAAARPIRRRTRVSAAWAGSACLAYGAGAKVTGKGGVGTGVGTGTHAGSGGSGTGFGGRGSGHRRGATGQRRRDQGRRTRRRRRPALALSPSTLRRKLEPRPQAAVHRPDVHRTRRRQGRRRRHRLGRLALPRRRTDAQDQRPLPDLHPKRLLWLLRHQERDGNLAKGCVQPMYSHGLATIALCEAYGLSGDHNIGAAAQGAVNYIVAAQNKTDFGWRYNPGDPGDTSVVGWQVMGLKSAIMAGLNVGGSSSTDLACKWFDLVKCGPNGCNFQYQANSGPTPAMSAVGLLCRQYMGMKRNDPTMLDGVKYLMENMPDVRIHNVYYWYYATQVMHNYAGYEWDTWNRAMRKLLISTQIATGTLRQRELGPGQSVQGRLGRAGRPPHGDLFVLPDARGILSLSAAVQGRRRGRRQGRGGGSGAAGGRKEAAADAKDAKAPAKGK